MTRRRTDTTLAQGKSCERQLVVSPQGPPFSLLSRHLNSRIEDIMWECQNLPNGSRSCDPRILRSWHVKACRASLTGISQAEIRASTIGREPRRQSSYMREENRWKLEDRTAFSARIVALRDRTRWLICTAKYTCSKLQAAPRCSAHDAESATTIGPA